MIENDVGPHPIISESCPHTLNDACPPCDHVLSAARRRHSGSRAVAMGKYLNNGSNNNNKKKRKGGCVCVCVGGGGQKRNTEKTHRMQHITNPPDVD
jgi:hypothetical protein